MIKFYHPTTHHAFAIQLTPLLFVPNDHANLSDVAFRPSRIPAAVTIVHPLFDASSKRYSVSLDSRYLQYGNLFSLHLTLILQWSYLSTRIVTDVLIFHQKTKQKTVINKLILMQPFFSQHAFLILHLISYRRAPPLKFTCAHVCLLSIYEKTEKF